MREPASVRWCLVANVGGRRGEGNGGTAHFSGGTKVWCLPPQWGDGYERLVVIGRHRGSRGYVTMILERKHLGNWRTKVAYDPAVIALLDGEPVLARWESRAHVERVAAFLRREAAGARMDVSGD